MMDMYQRAWRSVVLLAAATGAVAAVWASSLGAAVAAFVVIGANAACIRRLMRQGSEAGGWTEAVQTGLTAGALGLAACGLIAWLGPVGLSLVALLVLGSPPVLSAALRLDRRGAPVDTVGPGSDPRTPAAASLLEGPWLTRPTTSMDDASLCRAWRVSFVALRRPMSASSRLLVVERRRELLDELERRHARGFQTWLASGARAASDPTRYIAPAQHDADHRDPR